MIKNNNGISLENKTKRNSELLDKFYLYARKHHKEDIAAFVDYALKQDIITIELTEDTINDDDALLEIIKQLFNNNKLTFEIYYDDQFIAYRPNQVWIFALDTKHGRITRKVVFENLLNMNQLIYRIGLKMIIGGHLKGNPFQHYFGYTDEQEIIDIAKKIIFDKKFAFSVNRWIEDYLIMYDCELQKGGILSLIKGGYGSFEKQL